MTTGDVRHEDPVRQSTPCHARTILVTEGVHPYMSAWWPAGHIIGWEHTFTHGVYDLINGIAKNVSPEPTFDDGVRCQAVLDAIETSASNKQWITPDY